MSSINTVTGRQDPWDETLSSEIYTSLTKMDEGKKAVKVLNKGTNHEIFCFGDDQAHLYKRLEDGTVGESNGVIRTYVEHYEFHHKDWWKRAIGGNINLSVRLLPVSLEQLAKNAHLSDSWLLNPSEVAQKYSKNKSLNENEKLSLKNKISNLIVKTFKDLCANDFTIKEDDEFVLRLVPLTEDAKLIDLEKNTPYQDKIKKISGFLSKFKTALEGVLKV